MEQSLAAARATTGNGLSARSPLFTPASNGCIYDFDQFIFIHPSIDLHVGRFEKVSLLP
jgi:hypothetical protein